MRIRHVLRHDLAVVWRTNRRRAYLVSSLTAVAISVYLGVSSTDSRFLEQYWTLAAVSGGFMFPAIALTGSAVSIAGDRESGRLRLLLATPTTIKDVYAGTVVSRSVAHSLLFSPILVITALILFETSISVNILATFTLANMVLILLHTVVGVVISLIAATRLQAAIGAVVFYLWSYLWPQVVSRQSQTGDETVLLFLSRLSPFGAYAQATSPLVNPDGGMFAVPTESPLLSPPAMLVVLVVITSVFVISGYRVAR